MKCITVKMMSATCVVNVVLIDAQVEGEDLVCGIFGSSLPVQMAGLRVDCALELHDYQSQHPPESPCPI